MAARSISMNRCMMGMLDIQSAQAVGLPTFYMLNLFEHKLVFYTRCKPAFENSFFFKELIHITLFCGTSIITLWIGWWTVHCIESSIPKMNCHHVLHVYPFCGTVV